MIRLHMSRVDRWITLACGVELLVRPMTSVIWSLARNAAPFHELPDDAPPDTRMIVVTAEIAKLAIVEWRGVVGEDGSDLPPDAASIAALLNLSGVNADFSAQIVVPYLLLLDEKKGFAPPPSGTLAVVPNTANPATDPVPPVPAA